MRQVILCSAVLLCLARLSWGQPVPLDEPTGKALSPEERSQLKEQALTVFDEAVLLYRAQKLKEAEPGFRQAVALLRQLHPDGQAELSMSLNNLAVVLQYQGRLTAAEPLYREALAIDRRLYPESKYPLGHADLAISLNRLASVLHAQGQLTAAEPLYRDALAMRRRLYPESKYPLGHLELAASLNNLAAVLQAQGQPTAAERLLREALDMKRRLYTENKYPDGHTALAESLNNLAMVLNEQGKLTVAEPLHCAALDMYRRLYPESKYPLGHREVAVSLNNLASCLKVQGKPKAAEPLYREALAMRRRLYPETQYRDGHPDLAASLNNLAACLNAQGKPKAAEPLYGEVLATCRRLYPESKYPDGHPHLALSLSNLATFLHAQGKASSAESLCREALAMYQRLAAGYALARSEGDALNYLSTMPQTLDLYLVITGPPSAEAATSYAAVWDSKAALGRVFARRHLAACAATASPRVRQLWHELTELRRQRAELLLAPQTPNPATRQARDKLLESWAQRSNVLQAELRTTLPELARTQDLVARTAADIQAALPAGGAFIDFLRYTRFASDPDNPGKAGENRTPSYVAFVVTATEITRVELGPAEPIDKDLTLWRQSLTGEIHNPKSEIRNPTEAETLRRLVWQPVARHLPAGTSTVWLAPDQRLAFLPFAALPGGKPGTVLLEDFALAVVPSGPFLLDQLTATKRRDGPSGLLAVGGVGYDQQPAGALAADLGAPPGSDQQLRWPALPGTAAEVARIGTLAAAVKVPVTTLRGAEPSVARLLRELTAYRYAHLATHGFFADPTFRTRLQVDDSLFRVSGQERVGAGALSPFVLSGVVCAGANLKETPARGLLTAEALLNADLSGLELAVLSACETGLGEVADGEGVLGLQRGFHVAGARNVIASLWKVDDEATAALMSLFYHHLWEDKMPALQALRQAQLTLYRHPERIPALARTRGPDFTTIVRQPVAPTGTTRAAARLWAAFVLSGPGR